MAHTKAKGTSKLGRDSNAKRLGVKVFSGQKIEPGMIIVRQRGEKYRPGAGVAKGADDTLYAKRAGTVSFEKKSAVRFSGRKIKKTHVLVK
jgi:large subunit ribosomal protein L27